MRTFLSVTLVGMVLVPSPAVGENDLYARQLASATASARTSEEQVAGARAGHEYARKRRELLQQLNTLSGAFGGVALRSGLALVAPGYLPLTAGVLATYAIKSFLDRETARLLMETGRTDRELHREIRNSVPGPPRAQWVARALRDSSFFGAETESGVLLAHGYDVAAHLTGADFEDPFWEGIFAMSPEELEVALALGDRENYVEAVETIGEFRSQVYERASEVDAIHRGIMGRDPSSVDASVTPQADLQLRDLRREAEDLVDQVSQLDSSGRAVIRMLATTGVLDSEESRRLQSGLDTVVGVGSAWAGLTMGNPMLVVGGAANAITGVTGLFSDGEPSGEAALLTELLEGQQALLEGQELLLRGQSEMRREIAKTHLAVLDSQEDVLTALQDLHVQLTERIGSGFTRLGEAIREIRLESGQLAVLTREYSQLHGFLAGCANFLDSRRAQHGEFFRVRREFYSALQPWAGRFGQFTSWRVLDEHYRAFAGQWTECMTAMQDVFSTEASRRIHPVFRLAAYPAADGGTMMSSYVDPGATPLVRFVDRHYSLGYGVGGVGTVCALLNSPGSYRNIDFRAYSSECGDAPLADPFGSLRAETGTVAAGRWLLRADAVVYYVKLLLEVLPYYQLRDQDQEAILRTASDVAFGRPERPRGEEVAVVEAAYRLVSLAIAQQALLSGELVLPLVHRYLWAEGVEQRDRNWMVDVLAHNPLIARNYLVMQLGRELRLRSGDGGLGSRTGRYRRIYERLGREIGSSEGNREGYQSLFASYWEFAAGSNAVLLRSDEVGADGTAVDLPTPDELEAGVYGMTREYWELVQLRGEVIEYVYRNDMEIFGGAELVGDGYWVWQ